MDKKVKLIGASVIFVILAIFLFGGESEPDLTNEGQKALKSITSQHDFMIKYLDEQHDKCLETNKKDFCNKRTDYAKGEVEKNFKIKRASLIESYKK